MIFVNGQCIRALSFLLSISTLTSSLSHHTRVVFSRAVLLHEIELNNIVPNVVLGPRKMEVIELLTFVVSCFLFLTVQNKQ